MGIAALDAALAGLRVSKQQIDVVSNNVANATTPGYTRKILPQSTQVVQGKTVGVIGETIIRNVDSKLERDLWTQISSTSALSVKETYLERIEQFHGDPAAEISIASEMSRLIESFTALSDNPDDRFLLANTVDQSLDMTNKINDMADLLNTLRSDSQAEIALAIDDVNALLNQIAVLNQQIDIGLNVGRSVAAQEDLRSAAVKELSEYLEITYFIRGDGVMVVQDNRGVELAGVQAEVLTFTQSPIYTQSVYPDNIAGIILGEDPTAASAIDLTRVSMGGKLGGLIELRDEILPSQIAQLDELAHKLALRFSDQGLLLFTDSTGNLPLDTAPDPSTNPVTPVEYVGFASRITVNPNVQADPSLLQQGTVTTDTNIQSSSNEVIRRILDNAFGEYEAQEAQGTIDMRAAATGATTLQAWLGITSENIITGGRSMESFTTVADLVTSANGDLDPPADEFQITFSEPRSALGPTTITVSLTNAALQAGATATDQIVAEINAQILAAAVPAGLAATASTGPNGEILLNSTGTINIDGSFGATGMGQTGLTYLGINEGTTAPNDPYFDIQIGGDNPYRIYIEPGDTEADLIDKLILNAAGDAYNAVGDTTGVPGLAYDDVTFAATGELILRPGDDYTNPSFGGNLRISSGAFYIDPATSASPDLAALGAGNSVNIVSAIFGSFNAGPPLTEASPVVDIPHSSVIDASSTATTSFRTTSLGPGANLNTGLAGIDTLLDFTQRMVNAQTQELVITQNRKADDESLMDLLDLELQNQSGVNIDEELSFLIVVQTAYSASARVITAVSEMFDDLLRAV